MEPRATELLSRSRLREVLGVGARLRERIVPGKREPTPSPSRQREGSRGTSRVS